MRTTVLAITVTALAGCGVASGGGTYRVKIETSDGTRIEASADVSSESESVEASLIRDEHGIKSIEFKKTGTAQPERTMLDVLERQTELLNSVLQRVPGGL